MKDDMSGLQPLKDGSDEYFREITPEDYVIAPCMIKYQGMYYFMWSAGDWTRGTYHVNYCASKSPIEGFHSATNILSSQLPLADGPGHHGFICLEERDEFLITYHRRIPGDTVRGHRVLCLDKMHLHDGVIDPVIMTESFEL